MPALPALRNVDPIPLKVRGDHMICISDPLEYVDDQMVLSPPAFFIAACLDGERDMAAVRTEFAKAYNGNEVSEEDVRGLVDQLDNAGFLYTESFLHLQRRKDNAFRALHERSARLAGSAYPDTPEELGAYLDQFLVDAQGPGAQGRVSCGSGRPLRGLVAPHIDFDRGGNVYGDAYMALYRSGKPDLVILLGVAHAGAETPFVLTRKHFETPLGKLETDQEAVSRLEAASVWDPYASEMVHRTEHSLEFQAVMLAHLYGADVSIVPVLCSFPESGERSPEEDMPIQRFLAAVRDITCDETRCVTVIAAADLAHVGRRFGDDVEITEALIREVSVRDQQALEDVVHLRPDAFFRSVMADDNQRRVCGLGCIYAALKAVESPGAAGTLLSYDYAPDPLGGIVSFAAVSIP